jgi:chromosomal replication initiation ATPase DnaA
MNYQIPNVKSMPIDTRYQKALDHFLYPPRPGMVLKVLRIMKSQGIDLGKDKLNLEAIVTRVCRYFKIDREDLMKKSRRSEIVKARQICMYLSRRFTNLSLQQIADYFMKDHCTTLYACRQVENHYEVETEYRHDVDLLIQRLKV